MHDIFLTTILPSKKASSEVVADNHCLPAGTEDAPRSKQAATRWTEQPATSSGVGGARALIGVRGVVV